MSHWGCTLLHHGGCLCRCIFLLHALYCNAWMHPYLQGLAWVLWGHHCMWRGLLSPKVLRCMSPFTTSTTTQSTGQSRTSLTPTGEGMSMTTAIYGADSWGGNCLSGGTVLLSLHLCCVCAGSLLRRRPSETHSASCHLEWVLATALACVLPYWRPRWPWSRSWGSSDWSGLLTQRWAVVCVNTPLHRLANVGLLCCHLMHQVPSPFSAVRFLCRRWWVWLCHQRMGSTCNLRNVSDPWTGPPGWGHVQS